jgi:hypothetical protein
MFRSAKRTEAVNDFGYKIQVWSKDWENLHTRIEQLEATIHLACAKLAGCNCSRCSEIITELRKPFAAETFGEHPGGGPCIHVWALTNRSAIDNGKCELCGNIVTIGERP